jgi:hypothetical protein
MALVHAHHRFAIASMASRSTRRGRFAGHDIVPGQHDVDAAPLTSSATTSIARP